VLVPPEESETLGGFSARLRPAGDPAEDNVTVPAKLLRLVRVIVEVEVDPALTLSEVGLEEMVKSGGADAGVRNSVIGVALASFEVRLASFQFASIVFNAE
jgi:hypothetical protein